ncbi:hypothetical protein [Haloferax sp. Atlit-6N]|uniref:hypothetical protein n=1 Tax=Haloferax sp. Atlit-6N TaxID=2077205 RepID=UPI0011C03A51|nr:hypothetical protein [Haloferax sp. Atlit-6N]
MGRSPGREPFSAPEKSQKEQRREATLNTQYAVVSAFLGAIIGSVLQRFELVYLIIGLVCSLALPFVTIKFWDRINRWTMKIGGIVGE